MRHPAGFSRRMESIKIHTDTLEKKKIAWISLTAATPSQEKKFLIRSRAPLDANFMERESALVSAAAFDVGGMSALKNNMQSP